MNDKVMNDETKLNCAGEFMSACENPHQLSTAVGLLSSIVDGGVEADFLEELCEALSYCVEQAKETRARMQSEDPDLLQDILWDILSFSHTYLVKAYEKKVGRA
jgi:antitoxin component HigA of HigAB toxin-antitoxin module